MNNVPEDQQGALEAIENVLENVPMLSIHYAIIPLKSFQSSLSGYADLVGHMFRRLCHRDTKHHLGYDG